MVFKPLINTLDLDKINKEQLEIITQKIKNNECCKEVIIRDSNTKGYHIIIICRKNCDLCRFVFDDAKRYDIDSVMPLRLRDFLFTEKIYLGNLSITQENLEKIRRIEL